MNHSQEIRRGVRSTETESRWWGPGAEEGDVESVFNGDRVSVWEDKKVLEVDGGDVRTTMRMYLKPLISALWQTFCYVYSTTILKT